MLNENYMAPANSVKAERIRRQEFVDKLLDFLISFGPESDEFSALLASAIFKDEILNKDNYINVVEYDDDPIYPIPVCLDGYQSIFESPHLKATDRDEIEEYIGMTTDGIPYINIWCSSAWFMGAVVTVYWDGENFRLYIPVRGNYIDPVYNTPLMAEPHHNNELFEKLYQEAAENRDFYEHINSKELIKNGKPGNLYYISAQLRRKEHAKNVNPGYLYLYSQKIVCLNLDSFDDITFYEFDPITGILWHNENDLELWLVDTHCDPVSVDFDAIYQEINRAMY